jgi:ubiquinone/menaquinone biosynthesis C-methylase UbiE
MEQPMRCGAKPCHSSMKQLPDVISGNCIIDFVKQAWPRLQIVGLDMSDAYVRHAKRHLRHRSRTRFVVGKAEAIPLADNSQDAVTSIFLFHELPPKVRRSALRECARVLKPGGRLILLDSLQRDDQPDYEGLLQLFPENYHEPYYASYTREDFAARAAEYGLIPTPADHFFAR